MPSAAVIPPKPSLPKRRRKRDQLLLNALALSLLLHLLCYGVWKWGQPRGWWTGGWRPAWVRALSRKLLTPVGKKETPRKPPPEQRAIPLVFVETDPALAVAEPPKDAKFYSANNTVAANKEIKKPSDLPNITGTQTHELKTTDSGKSKAIKAPPAPKPEQTPEERPESQPHSSQSITPGDLVMTKPRELLQTNEGKAEIGTGEAAATQPVHHRPRTIQQALQERGMIGAPMRQLGGAAHIEADSSFAAMGTSYGDYDSEFIAAVKTRWYQLLDSHPVTTPGRVVVTFTMTPTGAIRDLKVAENTADELAGIVCSAAISGNAPYRPWPRQMLLDLGTDHREVRFTFYYDNQ